MLHGHGIIDSICNVTTWGIYYSFQLSGIVLSCTGRSVSGRKGEGWSEVLAELVNPRCPARFLHASQAHALCEHRLDDIARQTFHHAT